MVRVKLNEEGMKNVSPEDPYLKSDKIYEAFELGNEKCCDEFYKRYFVLNIGAGIYQARPEEVEIIEEESTTEIIEDGKVQKMLNVKHKILLVEDGSVDIDDLEEWCAEQNIKLIVYRNGANKPEWLNL